MIYLKNVTTLKYDAEKCTGCGRCVEVCPHAVFSMKDKRAVLGDKDKCMECGACEKNCSYNAIHVTAGVGCAAAILGSGGGEPACGCSDQPASKQSTACCG
jgi:NAD-dependent dihydropyrimidine dehydrogenase PreA subunit